MSWFDHRDPGERFLRWVVLAIGLIMLCCGAALYYQHRTLGEGGAGVCFIVGAVFVLLALFGKAKWLENIGI